MSFQLSQLLAGQVPEDQIPDLRVGGVRADSRAVAMEDAFFALPGSTFHGNEFALKAVERGARVVVTDRKPQTDPGAPVVVAGDVRRAYAIAASRISGPQPDVMVAVTGTNGKTSVAAFVRQIWQSIGLKCASIGTLGVQIGDQIESGTLTTPDALAQAQILARLKSAGINHVVMEASSHGLDQRRLDGVSFKVAGFTNLTRDHMDYHPDVDAYRDAKLRLFSTLLAEDGSAVINCDDPEHVPFMFAALERGCTLLTVGDEGAFVEIDKVEQDGWGQKVSGRLVGEDMSFRLPLVGRFQVSNALIAAAIVLATGADKDLVIPALERLEGAKGRLEHVGTKAGAAVFVDYAHTPEALETALKALRPFVSGKLAVLFGAGGDRDTGKRPMMGKVAAECADDVIVTDDNPRTEDAAAIRREILEACPNAREIGSRSDAIHTAISELSKGDVLLIAGKGHEDYQLVGTAKMPFSDHEVAIKALQG